MPIKRASSKKVKDGWLESLLKEPSIFKTKLYTEKRLREQAIRMEINKVRYHIPKKKSHNNKFNWLRIVSYFNKDLTSRILLSKASFGSEMVEACYNKHVRGNYIKRN